MLPIFEWSFVSNFGQFCEWMSENILFKFIFFYLYLFFFIYIYLLIFKNIFLFIFIYYCWRALRYSAISMPSQWVALSPAKILQKIYILKFSYRVNHYPPYKINYYLPYKVNHYPLYKFTITLYIKFTITLYIKLTNTFHNYEVYVEN